MARLTKRFRKLAPSIGHLRTIASRLEQSESVDESWDAELEGILRHIRRPVIECPLVGISNAGKSTLLNALAGDVLLPTPNTPSTAFCTKMVHGSVRAPVLHIGSREYRGRRKVQAELAALEEQARAPAPGGHRRHPSTEGDVRMDVRFRALSGLDLRPYSFAFVDTPSVSESGNGDRLGDVIAAVMRADLLVLVMHYTQLKTVAERALIARCAASRPDLFERPGGVRCVVTHSRHANRHGLDPGEVVEVARRQIRGSLPHGVRAAEPCVHVVDSQVDLLARLVSRRVATLAERYELASMVSGLSGQRAATKEELAPAFGSAFEQSRIGELETAMRVWLSHSDLIAGRLCTARARILAVGERMRVWALRSRRLDEARTIEAILGRLPTRLTRQIRNELGGTQ